jgi:hypothetical protein
MIELAHDIFSSETPRVNAALQKNPFQVREQLNTLSIEPPSFSTPPPLSHTHTHTHLCDHVVAPIGAHRARRHLDAHSHRPLHHRNHHHHHYTPTTTGAIKLCDHVVAPTAAYRAPARVLPILVSRLSRNRRLLASTPNPTSLERRRRHHRKRRHLPTTRLCNWGDGGPGRGIARSDAAGHCVEFTFGGAIAEAGKRHCHCVLRVSVRQESQVSSQRTGSIDAIFFLFSSCMFRRLLLA